MHIDDIFVCDGLDDPSRTRTLLGMRPGKLELQESSFAHVGMELPQADDYSARWTQADFSAKLDPLETLLARLGARRQSFAVNANWDYAGLQRRRAHTYARASPNWRPRRIRSRGAISIA